MKKSLLLLFFISNLPVCVYSQTHNDGPIELTMRVRDINVTATPTDAAFFGPAYATEEYTFILSGRDNTDLDGLDWLGPQLLTHDFSSGPPGNTADFNQIIFNQTYPAGAVPDFLDIKLEAWEDDSPDALLGVPCASSRNVYETGFCCGGEFAGSCLGAIDSDDNYCNGNAFITGLDYRLGAPGQWYDHGYLSGTCANNFYHPRIETFWRYVNGDNLATPIDLGALSVGSQASHTNNTSSYTNQLTNSDGKDIFCKITTNESGNFLASLCGAGFDTYLYLLAFDGTPITSDDNASACGTASEFTYCNLPAGTYYLVVDGATSADMGAFTLQAALKSIDADFSATPSSGCSPLTASFTDLSSISGSGTIVGRSWDFGDGANSNMQNPDHAYTTYGVFDVSLTVTDAGGCSKTITKSSAINTSDATIPGIVCPGNQQVSLNTSCQFILPDYTSLAAASDNCGTPVISQSPVMGTVITANQTITLTATDGAGNTAQCTFMVIPVDDTPPTISCPGDQQVSFNTSCEFILPDYTSLATASDNCGAPVISQSPVVGTVITTNQTITLTATDGAGNTNQCTFVVTPVDDTPPAINCPADQRVRLSASCQFMLADYTGLATASDNCGTPVISQSPSAGTIITTNQTITLTATDGAGNTTQCTFEVIPSDDISPTISCPVDQQVSFNTSCEFILPNYTSLATASDNCGAPVISQSPAVGTIITTNQTITLTATDGAGNSAQCTFNVIPIDDTPPVITCPSDIRSCDAVIAFAPPVGLDNCSGETTSLLSGLASGSTFPVGITTNTYEVRDGFGNRATCSFNVTRYESVTIDLGLDQTINGGFSYQINPVSSGASKFEWTPADGLDDAFSSMPVAAPQQTTLYTVIASSSNGCSATDDILITVNEILEVNNFMSPNGDGKNDTWEIKGNWLIDGCQVEVFNTWGNSVFKSTGYNNTWDGTSHGSELPDGVYYYVISCDTKTPLTGDITLKRTSR